MRDRIGLVVFCALMLGLVMTPSARGQTPTTWYVKEGATGNGSSWTNAYPSLQNVLASTRAGDQVWVAAGTYRPNSYSPYKFPLKNGVQVIGGFFGTPGTEGNVNARDPNPATNGTVLSGDLKTLGWSPAVVTASNVSDQQNTVLDGFMITEARGHAIYNYNSNPKLRNLLVTYNQTLQTGDADGNGAAIYNEVSSAPAVSDSTFAWNAAKKYGGAVYSDNSRPTFTNCQFSDNLAAEHNGGAVCSDNNSTPHFYECTFLNNRAGGDGMGGAIYNSGGSATDSLVLRNCTFSGNVAQVNGGAVWCQGQGTNPETPIIVAGCTFTGNVASFGAYGGGAMCVSHQVATQIKLINCQFMGNVTPGSGGGVWSEAKSLQMTNCLFANNSAANGGAAWVKAKSGQGSAEMVNCTFTGNQATNRGPTGTETWVGGVMFFGVTTGEFKIRNCIFWNNRRKLTSGSWVLDRDAQIFYDQSSPTVAYTCVQSTPVYSGTGNINTDPSFVAPDHGHYQLQTGSPCINAWADTNLPLNDQALCGATQQQPTPDLDCRARVIAGLVDMGAYEHEDNGPDCNNNGKPDSEDIASGFSHDCNGNGIPDECDIVNETSMDCNGNGIPDECDIASGTSKDCWPYSYLPDGIPDECQIVDCNKNCMPDDDDITNARSKDCDGNGVPDECQDAAIGRWTTNQDFERGVLLNVNHDISGELGRNEIASTKPLPYLWIAASREDMGQGTLVKINTGTRIVEGEYFTAPVDRKTNPSRTTVDLDGSVWAGNRSEVENGQGSIVKIGVVIGGVRVNKQREADPDGEYIMSRSPDLPITYCTCEDRDGDGLIRTSRGAGDVLAWPDTRGVDTNGGVSTAEDECIIRYVRTGGTANRTLAVDKDNNLWVGGFDNLVHEKRNGFSGQLMTGPLTELNAGGYGGLVAHAYNSVSRTWSEILWSARGGSGLLRYVVGPVTGSSSNLSRGNYGLGFNPLTANIWHSLNSDSTTVLYEIDPLTTSGYVNAYTAANFQGAKGVAVDNRGHVWVAGETSNKVMHLRPDPPGPHVLVGYVEGLTAPTGVSVDAGGYVWVSEKGADRVSRIDPSSGAENPQGSGFHVGAVDTSIPLGFDSAPYNYSDMTGMVGLHTSGTGAWSVVHDGGIPDTTWGTIHWVGGWSGSGSLPTQPDERLEVGVRAANSEVSLALLDYTPVSQPGDILPAVQGRFIQIRVRFHGPYPVLNIPARSPLLSSLSVSPVCSRNAGDVNGDGFVDGRDIQPFIDLLLGTACADFICSADIDKNLVVDINDVAPFVGLLLGAPMNRLLDDCNSNGTSDSVDIANATSQDCNHNFIPDECDIANETSLDLNNNGIPDECEPDCNNNSLPDDKDIADCDPNDPNQVWCHDVNGNNIPDGCEPDCNHNGIPDAWDVSQETSEDCNNNGVPDECERDCNNNGVPDDCDIADETSLDCNGNLVPDECDLEFAPPRGSLDCNENGIPDECDIATGYSQDCNGNGFPDECDIASQVSLDENENGIPDECEEGQNGMYGGGFNQNSFMSGGFDDGTGGSGSVADRLEAWAEFHEWCQSQSWGPDAEASGTEQFQQMTDKLRELGLPVRDVWHRVRTNAAE